VFGREQGLSKANMALALSACPSLPLNSLRRWNSGNISAAFSWATLFL
jgi:hypothetical protein